MENLLKIRPDDPSSMKMAASSAQPAISNQHQSGLQPFTQLPMMNNINPLAYTNPHSAALAYQNLFLLAQLQNATAPGNLNLNFLIKKTSPVSEPRFRNDLALPGMTSLSPLTSSEKRSRTVFSAAQLENLERVFKTQQYVVGSDRTELAFKLNLTESQVKVWFQNRRIKFRKQNRKDSEPADEMKNDSVLAENSETKTPMSSPITCTDLPNFANNSNRLVYNSVGSLSCESGSTSSGLAEVLSCGTSPGSKSERESDEFQVNQEQSLEDEIDVEVI